MNSPAPSNSQRQPIPLSTDKRAHLQSIVSALLQQETPIIINPQGPSMTPWLRNGDHVQVRPLRPGEPSLGHIVLAHLHNRLVLHRLVKKKNHQLHIRGDAELSAADIIQSADIIGIATRRQRGNQITRLDSPLARLIGRIWHALRPLRAFK